MRTIILTCGLALVLGACSTEIAPSNPYDSDLPCHDQEPSRISGKVDLNWAGDLSQVEVRLVPAGLSTRPDANGEYLIQNVVPCTQEIHFELEGFVEQVYSRLPPTGGELVMDVLLDPEKGGISGTVDLNDRDDNGGVTVSVRPVGSGLTIPDLSQVQYGTLTGSDGGFSFDDLPAGDWQVNASRAFYLAADGGMVEVSSGQIAPVAPMTLLPVVGSMEIIGSAGAPLPGRARYTNDPQVDLRVLAVNSLSLMTSEDPDFAHAGLGDVDWRDYDQINHPFSLSAGDGTKTVYGMVQGTGEVNSEVFEAQIVLDTTPPEGSVAMVLSDQRCDENDLCYTNSESLLISINASEADLAMRISMDDNFNEPVQLYTSSALVMLADTGAPQQVHVRLIDEAHNTTEAAGDLLSPRRVVLDLNPPTIPVFHLEQGQYTSTANVTLTLDSHAQDEIALAGYELQVEPKLASLGNSDWVPVEFVSGQLSLDLNPCVAGSCTHQDYLFKLRARDRSGNIGDFQAVSLVYDPIAPQPVVASVEGQPGLDESNRVGSTIINADAVTVWVSLDSSADPNFEQFLVNMVDPADPTSWQETGVGSGGSQIPILLNPDTSNVVWVKGRDWAGNESTVAASSQVTYIEDSKPPYAPILYPDEVEVNAEQVRVRIEQQAQDLDGQSVSHYELVVNGQPKEDVPFGQETFLVDALEQNDDNTVQLRAVDMAGNRSGTAEATITENSNLLSLESFQVGEALLGALQASPVKEVHAAAMENDLLVAAVSTNLSFIGNQGLVLLGLKTNDFAFIPNAQAQRLQLIGGRFMVAVPLSFVCGDTRLDPMAIPADSQLCNCHNDPFVGPGIPSQACLDLGTDVASRVVADNLHTLVMVDFNRGLPLVRWFEVTGLSGMRKHPVVGNDDRELNTFSFDGLNLAWSEGSGIFDDNRCDVYAASLVECDLFDPLNPLDTGRCEYLLERQWSSSDREVCGGTTIAEDYVVWGEKSDTEAGFKIGCISSGSSGWLAQSALRMGASSNPVLTADCYYSGQRQCDHFFWADYEHVLGRLHSVALDELPTDFTGFEDDVNGENNPARALIDELHAQTFTISAISARQGRVAWQNGGYGTEDVMMLDLNKCQTSCLGNARDVSVGPDRDVKPALSGDRIAYWRQNDDGYSLRLADLGHHPWLLADRGMQAYPKVSGSSAVFSYLDPAGGGTGYNFALVDLDSGQFALELEGPGGAALPLAFRVDQGAGGPEPQMVFLYVDPDTGLPNLGYCAASGPACSNALPVHISGPGEIVAQFRGDEHRAVWTAQSFSSNETSVRSCDLDSSSGSHDCTGGVAAQRVLMDLQPTLVCGSDVSCSVPGCSDLAIQDFSVDGDDMVILVRDRCNELVAQLYRIKLGLFEQNISSVTGLSVRSLLDLENPLYSSFITRIPEAISPDDSGANGPENIMATDGANVALAEQLPGCPRCTDDNPETPLVDEGCLESNCCGSLPCLCTMPAGNQCQGGDSFPYNQIRVFMADGSVVTVPGWQQHEKTRGLTLRGDWLAWESKVNEVRDVFVANLVDGRSYRLTYKLWGASDPLLAYFPDGKVHLMWTDARLGTSKIFHTPLD